MSLSEYFENTPGTGVLATADKDGNVDVAFYSRPHVNDENTVSLIMNETLSYENIKSNPNAAYLFHEDSPGYKGMRLYLKMTGEDDDQELIESVRRKTSMHHISDSKKHLVFFQIEKKRALNGK